MKVAPALLRCAPGTTCYDGQAWKMELDKNFEGLDLKIIEYDNHQQKNKSHYIKHMFETKSIIFPSYLHTMSE